MNFSGKWTLLVVPFSFLPAAGTVLRFLLDKPACGRQAKENEDEME
jgi:hypothetical protein